MTSFRSHGQRHGRGLIVLALLSRQTVRVARSIVVVRERASSSRRVVVFVATFARHRLAVTTQKFVRRVGVAEERTEGTSSSVLLDRAFLARQSDRLVLLHRYQIADLIVLARVRHILDDRARQHPRGTRVHCQVFDSRRETAHNVRVDALRGVLSTQKSREIVESIDLRFARIEKFFAVARSHGRCVWRASTRRDARSTRRNRTRAILVDFRRKSSFSENLSSDDEFSDES